MVLLHWSVRLTLISWYAIYPDPQWSPTPLTLTWFPAETRSRLPPLFLTWHYLLLGLEGSWEIWVTNLEIGAHQTGERIPVLLLGTVEKSQYPSLVAVMPLGRKRSGSRWRRGPRRKHVHVIRSTEKKRGGWGWWQHLNAGRNLWFVLLPQGDPNNSAAQSICGWPPLSRSLCPCSG